MRVERINEIERYILENGSVTSDRLCEIFRISKNTLLRDLNILSEKGTVKKVYGGVTAMHPPFSVKELLPFNDRDTKNIDLKNRIAGQAAIHIQPGDTIFVDTGTSTLSILSYITNIQGLTIITNSVQFMYRVLNFPNINVIALPGVLNHNTASLVGVPCINSLSTYNISKAFMACTAASLQSGVTNATSEEYEVKKVAMAQSLEHILLIDHTKFNQTSLMTYSQLKDFDLIITDKLPENDYIEYFKTHRVTLEIAE